MTDQQQQAISALSWEERSFPPSAEFVAQANAGPAIYEEAEADWRGFWMKQALAPGLLVQGAHAGPRRVEPPLLQVVRRR